MENIGDSSPSTRSGTKPHRTELEPDEPTAKIRFGDGGEEFDAEELREAAAGLLESVPEMMAKIEMLVSGMLLLNAHIAELSMVLRKYPEEFAAMQPQRERLLAQIYQLLKEAHA